jgi:glycosyltransferase involved in cell wall biosynthesis
MDTPQVSVVVTTHFRDNMLAECLQSLAQQTLPLHEIIVVDDGGSGTAKAVVAQFDERFQYLWQPNGGPQSARNRGTYASTGEWIAFLDDDDLWLPERHARIFELASTGQVDLIAGDFTKFTDDEVATSSIFDEFEQQIPGYWEGVSRESPTSFSIVGRFPTHKLIPVSPFWGATLVVRRDLFDRINGWNESLRGIKSEDNEFTFRAIKHGNLGIIWSSTLHYRIHPGNDSRSTLLNAIGRIQIWEFILTETNNSPTEINTLHSAINASLHEIIWTAFKQNKFDLVIQASNKLKKCDLSLIEIIKIAKSKLSSLRLQSISR